MHTLSQPLIRDIVEWEVRTWSRALLLWRSHLPSQRPARALAIGERRGGLSLWLALEGIDVVCSDLRPFGEETMALHRRYGVESHISYQKEDVTKLSPGEASFDVVVFKSVLNALGQREKQFQAMREIHRVLKPGGVVLFAENLRGTALHGWLRRRFVKWSHGCRYLDVWQDRELFASFIRLNDRTTGLLSVLGRSELQRNTLALLDFLLAPLTPRDSRTVWYGAAFK